VLWWWCLLWHMVQEILVSACSARPQWVRAWWWLLAERWPYHVETTEVKVVETRYSRGGSGSTASIHHLEGKQAQGALCEPLPVAGADWQSLCAKCNLLD
jgi:hypothetical protein